jgi:hypothetical protein
VKVRAVRALFVGISFFACVGCERLHDVKRCRALARQVNPSLDRIEAQSKLGRAHAGYDVIAFEYDAIAKGLEGFDGGTPELDTAVRDYASLARVSARQAEALAKGLAANNNLSVGLATHELERLSRQQKIIVGRIDEECRPK